MLSEDGQRLYVADTNNHALRVVDLAHAMVHTVDLRCPWRVKTTLAGSRPESVYDNIA